MYISPEDYRSQSPRQGDDGTEWAQNREHDAPVFAFVRRVQTAGRRQTTGVRGFDGTGPPNSLLDGSGKNSKLP
jgi:hypothetical protein